MIRSEILLFEEKRLEDKLTKMLTQKINSFKAYLDFWKFKLYMEYMYRRFGNNEVFRAALEKIYLKTFEKLQKSFPGKKEEELKEEFKEIMKRACLTRKVREMIEEDLEESWESLTLKKELNRNREKVSRLLREAFNACSV